MGWLISVVLSGYFLYNFITINNNMDDFTTKVQVEEFYDEQQLQEMHDFFEWLSTQNNDIQPELLQHELN